MNHSFENPSSLTHSFPFFDPHKLNSLETRAVEEKNIQSKIDLLVTLSFPSVLLIC